MQQPIIIMIIKSISEKVVKKFLPNFVIGTIVKKTQKN